MSDYYTILGVSKTASADEIKKAFRKKAMENHPDKHKGDAAAEKKFKEINEAYDALKDPQKRAQYDQFGKEGVNGNGGGGFGGAGGFNPGDFNFNFGGGGFSDIFENIFSEFAGAGRRQGARTRTARGEDLIYPVSITLEDAFAGMKHSVRFKRKSVCETCSGTGDKDKKKAAICQECHGAGVVQSRHGMFLREHVCPGCHGTGHKIENPCSTCGGHGLQEKVKELDISIPKGVDSGMRIRLSGEGNAAPFGGQSGDLFIEVHIEPHKTFERDGPDLFANVKIPFTTAIVGGEIELEMLDGKKGSIKVPKGTQPNTQIRLRSKGMPVVNSSLKGDLYVTIEVDIPKKINDDQLKALEAFEKASKSKVFGLF
ncbi:MAG: molecular chaperone DnaJ [Alphaproteobacteria bacterium]|nr:molecular chaperone DnaJ [Alphaproteobacteria bacterium]